MTPAETALEAEIKRLARADGPLRFDRYMELCLAHPEHGYYRTRDPFGRDGDFITAPEVSQMFGELIGVWCVDAWDAAGQPQSLQIVELGPGRGTLMADITRTLKSIASFQTDLTVHMVETSPVLRACQRETLAAISFEVAWHESLADVPDGPSLFIANEFFDALPVRQFEYRSQAWFERVVGLTSEGDLTLGLAPGASDISGLMPPDLQPSDGAVWEYAPSCRDIARTLAGRLSGSGAALVIDYGHVASGFGDTVQAVRAHEPVAVTHRPGECDLTVHVDFADLSRAFVQAGAQIWPALTQGAFLRSMGIDARADALRRNAPAEVAADIDAALARLTHCDQMGNLFKVCAAAGPGMRPPYPFGEMSS